MSLPITPVHPEGPRYSAPILFLPGLWARPAVWRLAAGMLAHRGWEGWIVDPRGAGGVAARADALAAVAHEFGRPPVVVTEDGGGVVALEVARRTTVAAIVWAAPVMPGGAGLRRMVSPWRVLAGLLFARPIERPLAWAPPPHERDWFHGEEEAALVVDVVRGRTPLAPAGIPVLLAAGEHDARCGPTERAALGARLDAELTVLPGAGASPLATGRWQANAGTVHRWLVRRLGETLLELYAEAMAERDDE